MAKKEGLTKDQRTIAEHRLQTEDGLHTLYVQEWGNPKGKPILYLHGGPGSGCHDGHKDNFNPEKYRVIFFDQRGCGHSMPYGSLKNNETSYLLKDIELIRSKLEISSWYLFGRSWGCTLALCYAISCPDIVEGIVTGGVYLGTEKENDWIYKGQFQNFYPNSWENFCEDLPEKHKNDPDAYRTKELLSGDNDRARVAAAAFNNLISGLLGLDDRSKELTASEVDPVPAMLEHHYKNNQAFLVNNYILDNAGILKMPIYIVQGRYDILCPPVMAYKLHELLPDSTLEIVVAGHRNSDRSIADVSKAILNTI